MKRKCVCLIGVLLGWAAFAAPTMGDVKVTPVAPWGLAIDYTVSGAAADDADALLVVKATGGGRAYTATSRNLSGDTTWSNGAHRVYWNMAKDGVTAEIPDGSVTVSYLLKYCVIDLSAGPKAEFYPIAYLDSEPSGGFNTWEYKTTKLVLKRVEAGSFIMGEDQSDESHRVTLTKPFYMALFETTQRQWELVMGSNPSHFADYLNRAVLPVECVSYNMIRGASEGAKWPVSNAVDADSFLGRLRARTGIDFDLPTEAQWEYACRAGTTTEYSYGDSEDGAYMWYHGNCSGKNYRTHVVGTMLPNPWGFYDLYGNVWEWCRDWYGNPGYGTDPMGPFSGSSRAGRGGSMISDSFDCTSSCRSGNYPSVTFYYNGFRLVRGLPD